MKILFICSNAVPFNAGVYQRVSHLLKAVASVADVTLVYPLQTEGGNSSLKGLAALCAEVFTFPEDSLNAQLDLRLPKPLYWLKHKLRYLHPFRSALMQGRYSKEANNLVADVCSRDFDVIWGERLSSIAMLPRNVSTRVIIDLDDLEHRSLRGRLRLSVFHHMTPLYWWEYLKLRRLELSIRSMPYELCVCSEVDRQILYGAKVWVVPNGIDLPNPHPSESHPPKTVQRRELNHNRSVVAFIGTMSYAPNVDAVLFFAKSILPLIQREIPDVEFLIVGRDPAPEVHKLHDGKWVVVTGTVAKVGKYYSAASVVVVPLRYGGGTRIKILEAMAHGVPVVSTTLGAEGLDLTSGAHLLIADSAQDFANASILLLKNDALRLRLRADAFRLVEGRYQWSAIQHNVANILVGSSGRISSAAEKLAQ